LHLDPDAVQSLLQHVEQTSWLRIMKSGHKDTPLGCGFGSSRFSSPTSSFKVIYLGETVGTSFAETVIRDRLEAVPTSERFLLLSEIPQWAIAEISSKHSPCTSSTSREMAR
jgi:hypothetical protein